MESAEEINNIRQHEKETFYKNLKSGDFEPIQSFLIQYPNAVDLIFSPEKKDSAEEISPEPETPFLIILKKMIYFNEKFLKEKNQDNTFHKSQREAYIKIFRLFAEHTAHVKFIDIEETEKPEGLLTVLAARYLPRMTLLLSDYHFSPARFLLDIPIVWNNNFNKLCLAAYLGQLQIDGLQCTGDDLNKTDIFGNTLLHYAASGNQHELIITMMSNGAQINHRNKQRISPITMAASCGAEEAVKILLQYKTLNKNHLDQAMATAHHNNHHSIVVILRDSKPKLEKMLSYSSPSPQKLKSEEWLKAIQAGEVEKIKELKKTWCDHQIQTLFAAIAFQEIRTENNTFHILVKQISTKPPTEAKAYRTIFDSLLKDLLEIAFHSSFPTVVPRLSNTLLARNSDGKTPLGLAHKYQLIEIEAQLRNFIETLATAFPAETELNPNQKML